MLVKYMKFETPYDAGFNAGLFGANTFNSHYSFFLNEASMKEWKRGNDLGSKKREADREPRKHRKI